VNEVDGENNMVENTSSSEKPVNRNSSEKKIESENEEDSQDNNAGKPFCENDKKRNRCYYCIMF
jgi:hypothetical protein